MSGDVFRQGDRVYVIDPALEAMRRIMQQTTGKEPAPNHHGTVEELWDDEMLLIVFDEDGVAAAGNAAPYPVSEVRRLTGA